MSATNLELFDIQGNILAGFNTDFEVLVGLTADDDRTQDIMAWLAALAPDVTSVGMVMEQRYSIKNPALNKTNIVWTAVSIGPHLISSMRPDFFAWDDAFNTGFRARAPTALGDRTNPNTWKVGGPSSRVDVLLIFASNDQSAVETKADEVVAAARAAGLTDTYRETAARIQDLEHFGFRDGISQPSVRYYDADGEIGPGYFVFGYERELGDGEYMPAVDPTGFLRNGSYQVFRRLEQDVPAFRTFCADHALALASQWPGLSGPHLQALLVGRWPSGARAAVDVTTDPGKPSNDNDFDFSDDTMGRSCPFGAHIRKVNPRAGPKDLAQTPRIIRRGIPFGPAYDASTAGQSRGLAFISYQTSIRTQLELLTSSWMNNPARPGPNAGHDLLVGRTPKTRSLNIWNPAGAEVEVSDGGQQWINPTGGAYLFAPGKSALARLTEPIAPSALWRTDKLVQQVKQSVSLGLHFLSHIRE